MDNREWAHKYVDAGWNIFPLGAKSKRPHFDALIKTGFWEDVGEDGNPDIKSRWESFQTERVTHELVDKWWSIDPDANIALVCGEISGVTVIDIDVKNIPKNELIPAEDIRWKICDMTLTSYTGSGGIHLFCNYSPGLKNSKKRVHPQVDIKNDAGYVVLPPSIHDTTGKMYFFDDLISFNEDSLSNLAEFPEALKKMVTDKQDGKMTRKDWAWALKGVREGTDGRNNIGTQVVGKCLRTLFNEFEQDRVFVPFIWDFLSWWNEKNSPPMKKHELESLFKSIIKRGL